MNDNAPTFLQDVYSVDVVENAAPGTPVAQLRAADADSAPNAVVEYYMTGDVNALDRFSVNPTSGA